MLVYRDLELIKESIYRWEYDIRKINLQKKINILLVIELEI